MKLLSVLGTRPQIVKAAVVHAAVQAWNADPACRRPIELVEVDTGQHYDAPLSAAIYDDLGFARPRHTLDAGREPGVGQLAKMLPGLDAVLAAEHPDLVVVYGDTTSTLAGALAARARRLTLAHIEAGVRSYNRAMQEETNRVVTDHLSDVRICPTPTAVENLEREGITTGVHLAPDVMEDALHVFLPAARRRAGALQRLALDERGFLLATVHRAETVDAADRLAGVLEAFGRLVRPIVWPCHPRTRARLREFRLQPPDNVHLIEPVGYLDMLQLEDAAAAILTDSGGVQREAAWLGVPCIVLRDETEWLETLERGHVLAGTTADRIVEACQALPPGRMKSAHRNPAAQPCGRQILEVLTAAAAQAPSRNVEERTGTA